MLDNLIQLKRRKELIEKKLAGYGINNRKISFLSYLDFSEEQFQPIYEVGCRILILWAVSYLSQNLSERDEIKQWLKTTSLWGKVSEDENKLFEEELPQNKLINFSWNIEAVIVLCWAINLLEKLPDLDTEISNSDLNALMVKLPIDQNPADFLKSLTFRDKEEILIENIINEMITGYLRDQMISKKKEELRINPTISFERHNALNWLRMFSGISDWDETDTST